MGKRINFIAFSSLLILIILGIWLLYSHGFISDSKKITDFIRDFGTWAYAVYFLIVLLEVVLAPIPGAILYSIGGILFGTLVGGTIALAANIIGAGIAFYIGKNILLDDGERDKSNYLDRMITKYGSLSIFFLRINPLTSSDVFSFLAGFLKMNFKKFLIATSLALAPLIYIQSYIGEEILLENKALMTVFIVASIIFIIFLLFLALHTKLSKWMSRDSEEN